MTTAALRRAALIGAVAGMRASAPFVGIARSAKPWEWYAFLGECVVDKAPFTPSRLEAGGWTSRVLGSAFAAHRDAEHLAPSERLTAALAAGASAFAAAKIAHDLRSALVRKCGCADIVIAAVEDAVALTCIVRLRSTQGGIDAKPSIF